jgi:transcriptional regulator with XRE-family HTH domain
MITFLGEMCMLGEKIKAFAKQKFGSLNDLAVAMNVNANQMSAYTTGRSKPSYEIMLKLYQQGCDINWLLDDNKPISGFLNNEEKDLDGVAPLSSEEIKIFREMIQGGRNRTATA